MTLKIIIALLSIALNITVYTQAQNLIRNPSFEQFDLPLPYNSGVLIENHVWDWFTGYQDRVGIFHTSNLKIYRNSSSSHSEWRRNFIPNSGKVALWVGFDIENVRNLYASSFFYSKLKQSLKKGTWYEIKVNVAPDSICVPRSTTVCFSQQKPNLQSVLEGGQQLILPYNEMVDKDTWTELSYKFKAQSDFAYIAIGAINIDQYKGDSLVCTGYGVDDISLEEIKSEHIISQILFQSNSAKIQKIDIEKLNRLYEQSRVALEVNIFAHTDNQGSEEINQQLSLERAEAVANFLISKGIASEIINYYGMGGQKPIADNNTEEGRAKNRRVEVIIVK